MSTRTPVAACVWLLLWFGSGCASTEDDLRGIAELPPLDLAILVSGGAYFSGAGFTDGTFVELDDQGQPVAPDAQAEAIPFADIVEVLRKARVCQHLVADDDGNGRAELRRQLRQRTNDGSLAAYLQSARDQGFDLLLLIEELQDGPIDEQGTNSRWPVTFTTWILLGVGAFIPDRTFESRATLRVSLRELQTGRELHNMLLVPGPVDLTLPERTDWLGLLQSILVPPFWVGDDRATVIESVRENAQRRLLLTLARDLKSEVLRRRIYESGPASLALVRDGGGLRVTVQSRESLSVVQLHGGAFENRAEAVRDFERRLLMSRTIEGNIFHYSAAVPVLPADVGRFQVKVATLRGGVASATFTERSAR
ncbi:MAG: hypothetical protein AB8H80_22330 [Planctomycetota bacterium]